jgi:hypothetical protein
MPLPNPKPLHVSRFNVTVPTVSSTSVVSIPAPYAGRIIKVGAQLGAASASADATVTTDVNGTAMTGGQFVITQAGSARGTTGSALPSALNTCNEDDSIGFVFSGSGTGGGTVTVFAEIRRGTI